MDIQAIFFDIDGTLVSFETHRIPQSTLETLDTLRQKGIKLIIATGRPFGDINNLGDLEFDGYITLNGAYCLTKEGTVLSKSSIPESNLLKLAEYLKKKPFPCIFMTEKGNMANCINEKVLAINKLVNLPSPPIEPIEKIIAHDIFQIDTFVSAEEEKFLFDNILTECGGSRWHPSFTDINVKGNNKATGIKAFLKYYGIKQENTMAFGDGGNDISMLKYVAVGVAMGNSSQEVKAAADYVTSSVDENGISNAIKHFI